MMSGTELLDERVDARLSVHTSQLGRHVASPSVGPVAASSQASGGRPGLQGAVLQGGPPAYHLAPYDRRRRPVHGSRVPLRVLSAETATGRRPFFNLGARLRGRDSNP